MTSAKSALLPVPQLRCDHDVNNANLPCTGAVCALDQVEKPSIAMTHSVSLHISPGFVTRATRRRGQVGFLALGRGGLFCNTLNTSR